MAMVAITTGRSAVGCLLFATLLSACGGQGRGAPNGLEEKEDELADPAEPPEEIPAMVALSASSMVSGFAGGKLRENMELSGFQITRHPITRADYQACVDAGACKPAKDHCASEAHAALRGRNIERDDSPQTCVSPKAASAYCGWIGGRLPSLSQWLLAARGPGLQKYAWGDTAPTCDQHPRAADVHGAFVSEEVAQEAGCVPSTEGRLVVGDYEAADAPSGMSDVLLTPGELLRTTPQAQFSACSEGFGACYVYGPTPGAISAVYPIDRILFAQTEGSLAPHVYAFRCVLEES